MNEESIPISEIRQYSFCPRIPWFHANFSFLRNPTKWMKQGEEYHIQRELLLKKKLLRRFQNQSYQIHYQVSVYSKILNIHGILDAFLETEANIYPIEFKMQKGSFSKGIQNQLIGYALCLEEMKQTEVNKGFLITGKNAKVTEIPIHPEDKFKLKNIIQLIGEIRKQNWLPDSPASAAKCSQCEYLLFCNDREL